jgi:hypothetical protein
MASQGDNPIPGPAADGRWDNHDCIMEKRKAPHVLFDDIDQDIRTKVEFLRKQNDLLKDIN